MDEAAARDPALLELDRLLSGPEPDEGAWYAAVRRLLERVPGERRSVRAPGMRTDAARWARGRRPIMSALDRGGTFLDVGCANGLLMESVRAWGAEAGREIEPYGLDFSAGLVDLAPAPATVDRPHLSR